MYPIKNCYGFPSKTFSIKSFFNNLFSLLCILRIEVVVDFNGMSQNPVVMFHSRPRGQLQSPASDGMHISKIFHTVSHFVFKTALLLLWYSIANLKQETQTQDNHSSIAEMAVLRRYRTRNTFAVILPLLNFR